MHRTGGISYRVSRLAEPPEIDARWDKSPWSEIRPEPIRNHMGKKPGHLPKTEVKVAYDEAALYAIFRVEDRYVRAVATEYQDAVCKDSCVEFFFTPNADVSNGYFNLETNCGGTALFAFQKGLGRDTVNIPSAGFGRIAMAHSLPRIVDPEIESPVTWTIEYRLPVGILTGYGPVTRPASGVAWRANFFKCADMSSHPHWLTWARVDFPTPRFHLPEFFGVLEFE